MYIYKGSMVGSAMWAMMFMAMAVNAAAVGQQQPSLSLNSPTARTNLTHFPSDPFTYHLPLPSTLHLQLSDYGPPLDDEAVISVYDAAITTATAHLHDPNPTLWPIRWTTPHEDANLIIRGSRHLSWRDLRDAVRGLERCMLTYGYYEIKSFSIVSPTRGAIAEGEVRGRGYGSSLGLAKLNFTTNTRLDEPPPAPFTYHLPDPPYLSLELSRYGPPLEREDVLDLYDIALMVINASMHDHQPLFPPGARGAGLWITNDNDTASLTVQYSRQMTWKDLADVVKGLESCMLTYGYFEIGRFGITHPEKGHIGYGQVKNETVSASSLSPGASSRNSTTNRLDIPPTPYMYRIASSYFSLALNFTNLGASIPDLDAIQVYVNAAVYIEGVLSQQRYSMPIPRGTVLHWSHNQVGLTLEHEDGMTWGEAAEVLNGLVAFQMREGYMGARFEVLREGRAPRGKIGGGTMGLMRPRSQGDDRQRATSRILPWDGGNTTAASDTSSEHLALLTMPPDPITLRIPDTTLSLTFSHYGRVLPQADFLTAMLKMTLSAIKEMQKPGGDHPIGEDQQWRWDRAVVGLASESEMKWGMLGSVVNGITSFAMRYGWLTFSFDIVDDKLGEVGAGFVEYV